MPNDRDDNIEQFPSDRELAQAPLSPEPQPEPEPEQPTHAERLRAVENDWFGEDHTRIDGQAVRGIGSKFQQLPAEHRAHHAALEHAAKVETKLTDARAGLLVLEQEFAAAKARVEATLQAAAVHPFKRDDDGE